MRRLYEVTVTPSVTLYAGTSVFGEYTVEVLAKTPNDAIKKAREERRAEEGRLAPSARFRARLKNRD